MLEMLMLIPGADMIKDLVARVARVRCRCSFIVSCIIIQLTIKLHLHTVSYMMTQSVACLSCVTAVSVTWFHCQTCYLTVSVMKLSVCDDSVSSMMSLSAVWRHCQLRDFIVKHVILLSVLWNCQYVMTHDVTLSCVMVGLLPVLTLSVMHREPKYMLLHPSFVSPPLG